MMNEKQRLEEEIILARELNNRRQFIPRTRFNY